MYLCTRYAKKLSNDEDRHTDCKIILNLGSEMIVAIAGDMLRMPGLPKSPQAERIAIENGEIEGLS